MTPQERITVRYKNLYERVMTVFGGVMVFFYLGLGCYLIFSPLFSQYDKFIRIVLGSTLILYGIARAFRTVQKVKEEFFSDEEPEDDNNRKRLFL